jgi:single-stranded-DNA-specific exonuclease
MDIARDVVELFTCRSEQRERELASKLNHLNAERQAEEQRIISALIERLDTDSQFADAYCLVIDGDAWHRGVIGIAATRVVERTGKPALVISRDVVSGEAHGSGRSIPGFHLLDALESEHCKPLFTKFGGHAHAVGFSLPCERVSDLRAAMDRYARQRLTAADFMPELAVDAELELSAITPQLFDLLCALEPFGMGNREPVFVARNVKLLQTPALLKEKHIKLRVAQSNTEKLRPFDALGWRLAEQVQQSGYAVGDQIELAYVLEQNQNPEFGSLQLVIKDLQHAAKPAVATSS